jgi:DNA-directed RNA polymerase I subunit RPA2
MELYPYSFMSVMANLTPFSEFNQSPRNMYQCQMVTKFIFSSFSIQF